MDGGTVRMDQDDTVTAPPPLTTELHALSKTFMNFELRLRKLEKQLMQKYATSESALR